MGNCANDCSSICGKDGEHGEFTMSVSQLLIAVRIKLTLSKGLTQPLHPRQLAQIIKDW